MAESDLDYAKVTGRFGLTVADGDDTGDLTDIIWCDEGTVRLTPLTTFTKVVGGSPVPWTAGHSVIDATIDSEGYLTHRDKRFVWVIDLTSEKVNSRIPDGQATHRVEFINVRAGGTRVEFPSAPVRLTAAGPDGDGVNDLTKALPVPTGSAVPIIRGEQGTGIQSATVAGGELLLELTDGTEVNAGELPVGPGGSDAGVADYINTPGTDTAAALSATIATGVETAVEDPAGAAAKRFSRGNSSYNVTDSSLRNWRRALAGAEANAATTNRSARLLFAGDSITYGAGLNSWTITAARLTTLMFERTLPAAGTGIVNLINGSQFQQDGSNNVDNRVNRVGTWTASARGAFMAGTLRATGTAQKLRFTETGSTFLVYYAKSADGGVISIDVDGGTPATIDTSGTGVGVHTIVNTIATGTGGTALTNASHIVTVTAPASGFAYVRGFEARIGAFGVRTSRMGLSGAQINSLVADEESLVSVFDEVAPDLTVLMMETNDYVNGHTAVATYKTRMAVAIARAKLTGDVLLVATVPPMDTASTPALAEYTAALYELADEYDCALLDMQKRWVSYAYGNPRGLYGDAFHPSIIGYRDLARSIYEVIGTTAPGTTTAAASLSVAQTFTARQTFSLGVDISAGQTLRFGGDTSITRDSGFVLSVNGHWKAQILSGNAATNLGAVNAKAGSGRAVSAQGSDGVERGGFSVNGRLYANTVDRQTTVGAAGAASAPPATPTTYIKVEDQSGNILVIPAYAAS